MKYFKQFDPIILQEYSSYNFQYPRHKQNYFELIFIVKGTGVSYLNAKKQFYQKNDLFFVSPEDNHHFEIKTYTKFLFIKFTSDYFKSEHLKGYILRFNFDPHKIFKDQYIKEQKLLYSDLEKDIIKNNFFNVFNTFNDLGHINSPVIFFQTLVILSVVNERLQKVKGLNNINNSREGLSIIDYIHQNIYFPKRLKVDIIANNYNMSSKYFSFWFSNEYQMNFKTYIHNYRLNLIKQRLKYSNFTLQEIANEFNFTDSSHFSNYFLKHTNIRPLEFRREYS